MVEQLCLICCSMPCFGLVFACAGHSDWKSTCMCTLLHTCLSLLALLLLGGCGHRLSFATSCCASCGGTTSPYSKTPSQRTVRLPDHYFVFDNDDDDGDGDGDGDGDDNNNSDKVPMLVATAACRCAIAPMTCVNNKKLKQMHTANTELHVDALQLRCCYAVVVAACGRQLGGSPTLNSVFDAVLRARLFELVALWCKEGFVALNAARPEGTRVCVSRWTILLRSRWHVTHIVSQGRSHNCFQTRYSHTHQLTIVLLSLLETSSHVYYLSHTH